MADVLTINTDHLPSRERLPYIVEVFSRSVVKVDWHPRTNSRMAGHPFHARARFQRQGPLLAAEFSASGGLVRRAAADAESDDAALLLTRHQTRSWYDVRGEEIDSPSGTLTATPSTLPFRKWTADGVAFRHRSIRLPLAVFGEQARLVALDGIRIVDETRPISRLFGTYLDSLFDTLHALSSAEVTTATEVLARLALVGVGALDPREENAEGALGRARLHRALDVIAERCHRADLSPAAVALALGISVRQLHVDFEVSGTTVARAIVQARVERAKRLLAHDRHRSITDVAFASGFEALSTFYRVFKQVTGMTASEFREMASGDV